MDKTHRLLIINPGSTSTKVAVFDNAQKIHERVLRHSKEELDKYNGVLEQKQMRQQVILNMLKDINTDISSFSAIVGRGGIIKPIVSGTYIVNDAMLNDLHRSSAALHASALGGLIAYDIAENAGINAYVVDPIVIDEMSQVAKISGIPEIERKSRFHALNQKAVAREYAKENNLDYSDSNFIVAHMGGGITIGAHKSGKVIDVNDGLAGEGPFSPERSGTLPLDEIIRICYSDTYTQDELLKKITKQSGMNAYIGTNDLRECFKMIDNGNEKAKLIVEAMAYQVSKSIGALSAALMGNVDAILLTGGLAHSKRFTDLISKHSSWIAPVAIYPGEMEMEALALGTLRVLNGIEKAKIYI